MELRADNSIVASPGNFASRIVDGDLLVPVALADFAREQHIFTAEELVGYVDAFPSSVAESLGWRSQAVTLAARRLHDQLLRAGYRLSRGGPKRVYGFG